MSKELIRNIPTNSSSDMVWISWYDALRKTFGKKKANALFLANWDAQNGFTSDANTSELRKHLKDKGGLEIAGSTLGEVKDQLIGIGNFFGDTFVIGKYFGVALGVIVIGGIGMLVYNIAKKPESAIRVGTAIATRGMSEAVPKK